MVADLTLRRESSNLSALPGSLSTTSLCLDPGLSFKQWEEVGATLRQLRDSSLRWWLGDWLNYGERGYGEEYTQAVDETDYTRATLHNMAWVCRAVQPSRRREGLSFSHHETVAALSPSEQDMWLADAESNGWGSKTLREMIAQTKRPTMPPPTLAPPLLTRTVDEDTGEVFGGGDWSEPIPPPTPMFTPDAILPAPVPFGLRDALTGGEASQHTAVAQWLAVTTHLYRAAREIQPLLSGWTPDDLAVALSADEAGSLQIIGPAIEFVAAVVAARRGLAEQPLRRVK